LDLEVKGKDGVCQEIADDSLTQFPKEERSELKLLGDFSSYCASALD
jgi:hypothetical protein